MASADGLILIVDDDCQVAESHQRLLAGLGHRTVVECDPRKVESILNSSTDFVAILLDLQMPYIHGRDLLGRLRLSHPDIGVIIVTVINDIEEAVRAIKNGAYNYLLKPLAEDRLREVLNSCLSNHPPSIMGDDRFGRIVTKSESFKEIFKRAMAFSSADVPVLIEGETGTGKELMANLLHTLSARKEEDFTAVNVAALSPSLFEAEFFGHAKGAYTGAVSSRAGYCEGAAGGTLFLDEIGELKPDEQKKILRLIQSKKYNRVGETQERELKARLLFATNKNLKQEVAENKFREDLFYRLSAHTISLPPLRERQEDIELLAHFFLRKYCSQYGRSVDSINEMALAALRGYSFPGNVRELEGIISAAVLLEPSSSIQLRTLPAYVRESDGFSEEPAEVLEGIRYRTIMKILAECDGNQTKASQKLGIARVTLNRLLRRYRDKDRQNVSDIRG